MRSEDKVEALSPITEVEGASAPGALDKGATVSPGTLVLSALSGTTCDSSGILCSSAA